ncbi:GNAT family N-acetyltransferase [Virgibacillus kekensis]|uniref:GNAT family N-acetyltransferase n=1 Tax=Virgibacillus kekensis TaxID=202261 RepID=A0ABV9DHD3_9BACI
MIKLYYFNQEDFDQLIGWLDSEKLLFQWGGAHQFSYPLDQSQLFDNINNANHEDSKLLEYKAVDQTSGRAIGHISLNRIDRKNKSARIGRVLVGDKNYRGQGIAREMINQVLKIAFEELNMHRVSLGVYDFNAPAITCYERAGFQKEGLLRDASKVGEEYWSQFEMSILRDEWLNHRGESVNESWKESNSI